MLSVTRCPPAAAVGCASAAGELQYEAVAVFTGEAGSPEGQVRFSQTDPTEPVRVEIDLKRLSGDINAIFINSLPGQS